MNSIIGMSLLALETSLDEEQNYLINTIHDSAEFLLGLINDILDFSKIEFGQFEMHYAPFKVEAIVTDILQIVDYQVRKKGLHLDYTIDSNIPQVMIGDELRLRQILLNLISNAIKFTEKGGIAVHLTLDETLEDELLLNFQVQDSGIGIIPEKINTIFEEFSQVDGSLSRHAEGTGLGLSICYKLCWMMGGKITVESEPGQGSTFTFTVLLKKVSAQEAAFLKDKSAAEAPQLPPLRILLVDDNESNRYIVQAMFKKNQHQFVEAVNGLEALNILVDHRFDVILMDIQMPKMDGITTTGIIRACEKGDNQLFDEKLPDGLGKTLLFKLQGGHIPIVALTAHAFHEDRQQCLEAGMDGYAIKPIQHKEISLAIHQAVFSGDLNMETPVYLETPEKSNNKADNDAAKKSDLLATAAKHMENIYSLDPEQVEEVLYLSSMTFAEFFEQAEQALINNDMEALTAAAHKAKGTLMGLGLKQEAECAGIIEIKARDEKEYAYQQRLDELRERIQPLLKELGESAV
jgi:CheY-like chemotaxis protein/HPt (histidine-containing phosphotransfer) domain-containing protein